MSDQRFDLLGRIVSALMTISHAWGVLVDLCEKLGSSAGSQWLEELSMFLRKEPTWVRRWREKDGVIYFSVTSDGTSGPDWIARLESKGFRVGDYAKSVLCSPDFKPTKGVTTEIAVLKGELFSDGDRITKKIRAEADKRKWLKPNAEVACLIREMFTDEEIKAMGLWWIVAFHEPIKDSEDSDGHPRLLGSNLNGDGGWLSAFCGKPDCYYSYNGGFAFASQVSS